MPQDPPVFFIVVGGPSGVGKSRTFPLSTFAVDSFNVDEYCARALNNGSFQNFTPEQRNLGLAACDEYVHEHFRAGRSVAVEASLRREITFQQLRDAKAAGFTTQLIFLGNDNVEENIRRVAARSRAGGHAARPELLREIYQGSMANLARALREFDRSDVFDNSGTVTGVTPPRERDPVLVVEHGRVSYVRSQVPEWLRDALRGTEYERGLSGTQRSTLPGPPGALLKGRDDPERGR